MFVLLKNAKVLLEGAFEPSSVFVANGKIVSLGTVDEKALLDAKLDVDVLDCKNALLIPGLIDPHIHLAGGSGEGGGFVTQSQRILVSECVEGGITTVVGTLGVDTTTKTMPALLASVKALNEAGLNAHCYTGGYDTPARTITNSVRDDILFIEEIIGVGEIAIADRRAPEPTVEALAKSMIDAYVAGMLSGKAGVSHFHVGEGRHRLKVVRDVMERHEIESDHVYFTHVERNEGLVDEAIQMAERGCYVDYDICEADLLKWYRYYETKGGRKDRLTFSSDAGVGSPAELWTQIRECVVHGNVKLEDIIPHVTQYPASVLKFGDRGTIAKGYQADLVVVDPKDFMITDVMSRGRLLMKNSKFNFPERPDFERRGFDLYDTTKSKTVSRPLIARDRARGETDHCRRC